MSRPVSSAFKQAIYAQQTSEVFIILLTIENDKFDGPMYISSDPTQLLPVAGVRGTISRGQEYAYLPFTIQLPSQDDTNTGKANVSIDNISREIVAAARKATTPLMLTIEIVLASDPDAVEVSVNNFQLESLTYDAYTISGDISLDYYDLEPFPCGSFTPSDFPGMF